MLRKLIRLFLEQHAQFALDPEENLDPEDQKDQKDQKEEKEEESSQAVTLRKSKWAPEASQDAPYEEYLFGDYRKGVDEPDVPEEQQLYRILSSHYRGGDEWRGSPLTKEVVGKLIDLRDQGFYTHWLAIPEQYTKAYRLMDNIDNDPLSSMYGESDRTRVNYGYSYEADIEISRGGIYTPQEGQTSSWTVDRRAILRMAEDEWFRISSDYPEEYEKYIAIAVVDLAQHRDKFVLNPDAMNRLRLPGKFAYQKEIIGLHGIPMEMLIYSQPTDKNWVYEREAIGDWEDGAWMRTEEDEEEMEENDTRPEITYEYENVDEYDEDKAEEYQTHRRMVIRKMVEFLP